MAKAKEEEARANNRVGRGARGRGRGRARGGRGQGGRAQRQAPTTTVNREGHRPIIIESQSDEEADGGNVVVGLVEEEVETEDLSDVSSSDSDAHFYSDLSDSDAVDGEPGAYYGGYGHCYRCGKGIHYYCILWGYGHCYRCGKGIHYYCILRGIRTLL
jgi:E3 ubiquitin-protein ligase RNF8